jgi:hypothetical protein
MRKLNRGSNFFAAFGVQLKLVGKPSAKNSSLGVTIRLPRAQAVRRFSVARP